MNAAAANALYEAERKGVRQIRGMFAEDDGRCAWGALRDAMHSWSDQTVAEMCGITLDLGARSLCPACGKNQMNEGTLIVHLNDDHGMSFSEIARKLGPDSV